jgi:hypothetical protein
MKKLNAFAKKEIFSWFHSGRDFNAGIVLFSKYSTNFTLLSRFSYGKKEKHIGKLSWELAKIAGISLKDYNKNRIPKPIKKTTSKNSTGQKVSTQPKSLTPKAKRATPETGAPKKEMPDVIVKIKKKLTKLFTARAMVHRKLKALGDSNEDEVCNQRKEILREIDSFSINIERLSDIENDWFHKGIIPAVSVLNSDKKETKTDNKFNYNNVVNIEDLPADGAELVKVKNNLISSLSKDRNMLQYNSRTKPRSGNFSPMPDGPKKENLLKRIKAKDYTLKLIHQKLDNNVV